MESVHSNDPDAPKIQIRRVDSDEETDDDDDATITLDLGNKEDDDDDDEDDEEEPIVIRPKKFPKSKSEDIHSFL